MDPLPAKPIRCLAMEQLASSMVVSCRHAEAGCAARVKYADYNKHLRTCEFRPFCCPFSSRYPAFGRGCDARGAVGRSA